MSETEQRRRELLESTRGLYEDRRRIPAIHPRYGSLYSSLYEEGEVTDEMKGSFGLRLGIGILCFICFVIADYRDITVAKVNSDNIVTQIERQIDVAEVWSKL